MIWVGLPAYNESCRINNLLMDAHKSLCSVRDGYKIVVYDDGSTDNTISNVLMARDTGVNVQLIKGKTNKGLGYGLFRLINYCADKSSLGDTIIIMDADATHNAEHIHRMLSYIKDGFDVVIASRYTRYSRTRGLRFGRRILSSIGNYLFSALFPIKGVLDYSCAYRAYTAKILKLAKDIYKDNLIEELGFSCMAEFLLKLRKLDILACEVPLILRYDKKAGPTKMNIISNISGSLNLALRMLFLAKPPQNELEKLREKYNT